MTDSKQIPLARSEDVRTGKGLCTPAGVLCTAMFFILAQHVAWATGFFLQGAERAAQEANAPTSSGPLSRPPRSWVDAAVSHELKVIDDDGHQPLRFRVHKIDAKSDTVRVEIETPQGGVARLVERNGQPLTATEDAAEQQRLRDVLDHPAEFARHHKRDAGTRQDTLSLVKQMPAAMLFSYVPGQPQWQGYTGLQVAIDFKPNPAFHPPSMAAEMLTGIEGRLWIDARSGRVVRIEAHVLKPVSFGWGIVGKIYPGGTLALEQANPAGDRWVYSRLDMHLNMRVVVKSIAMNDRMTASDFEALPAPVSMEEAVKLLLSMQVATR